MLEALVLLTFLGVFLSSSPKYGIGNPFQIYFTIWFLVFLGYLLTRPTWIRPPQEFLLLFLVLNTFWMLAFIVFNPYLKITSIDSVFLKININLKLVNIFQILSIIGLPLAYSKAIELSAGEGIFSAIGYLTLRASLTENVIGYGWVSYFTTLSLVTSSVSIILFKNKKIKILRTIISILITFVYLYLSTGRTFILMFFVIHLMPFILFRKVGYKIIIINLGMMTIAFILIAAMLGKGVSFDNNISDNISSFFINIRAYTIAPLLAFSNLLGKSPPPAMGAHTFRTLLVVLSSLGIPGIIPPALVREWTYVPDGTNVYTVYDIYFRDFGYFGFVIVIFFVILHVYLYRRAVTRGGIYIFLYSASVYPLIMQFFQDQYFSLLSTWIQIFILYWIVVKKDKIYQKKEIM